MGKKRLFNEEQENFILMNYKTMSNEQLAHELGSKFKKEQVNSWLIHRKIKRNGQGCVYKNSIFSKKDIEFIKNNYENMTCAEIGKCLGFTDRQIQGKVAKLNLKKKKRKINDDYFEKIDSPLKAYYLGFIYADGYIIHNESTGNYEFGMELQSCDKYILEKLNRELGNLNIIYHREPKEINMKNKQIIHSNHSDYLRIYSKKLVEDLMKNGIETNKSQKSIFPIVNVNLFFDFLRGYIDGDGCYYMDNNKNTYMHITSASKEPLIYIKNELIKFNIKTNIYCENDKKYRLMCTNYDSMTLLIKHLYYKENLFCLKRKYEKIKHFL